MAEEGYNKVHGAEVGRFTFTTRSGRDAFVRRLEKYDAAYEVDDHHIDGEWDTATIEVDTEDLRPLRYLIKASS